MDPVAVQNKSPRMWSHGELTDAQTARISFEQLQQYWLWCSARSGQWHGLSDVARRQGRRVRKREFAREARRKNSNRMGQLRTDLQKARDENEQLQARLHEPRHMGAPATIDHADADDTSVFAFDTFGVVFDNEGQPMMYIGVES